MADDEKRNDPPWGSHSIPRTWSARGADETRPREVPPEADAQDTPSGTPVPEDVPLPAAARAGRAGGAAGDGAVRAASAGDGALRAGLRRRRRPSSLRRRRRPPRSLRRRPRSRSLRRRGSPRRRRPCRRRAWRRSSRLASAARGRAAAGRAQQEDVPENIVAQTREGEHPYYWHSGPSATTAPPTPWSSSTSISRSGATRS